MGKKNFVKRTAAMMMAAFMCVEILVMTSFSTKVMAAGVSDTMALTDKDKIEIEQISPNGSWNHTPTSEEIRAEKAFVNILNKYVDPEYHLIDNEVKSLSSAQIKELKNTAKKAAGSASGEYARIQAVAEYVAENIYYDYEYYDRKYKYHDNTATTFWKSYEIHRNHKAVCQGYSTYTKTLLNLIGIPCMLLYGQRHAFNAAYAADQHRWVVMDVTWCSKNAYTYKQEWKYGGHDLHTFALSYYDMASLTKHEGLWLQGVTDGKGLYYKFYMGDADETWADQSKWYLDISGTKNKTAKASGSIAGYPVSGMEQYVFYKNHSIKDLDLSELKWLESLRDYEFCKCTRLKSIDIPASLLSIGAYCFYGCKSLKKVNLSKTKVTAIKEFTFYECKSMKYLSLPKSLKSVGKCAFHGGSNMVRTRVISRISKKKLQNISGQYAWYNRNIY